MDFSERYHKACIKDCILAVLWPREDIHKFLKDCDCRREELRCIENFKKDQSPRRSMIDLVFDKIGREARRRAWAVSGMLQRLIDWDRFDPYYFTKLKQLSREEADYHLQHLRQLSSFAIVKSTRNESIETKEAELQRAKKDLTSIRSEILSLHGGTLSHRSEDMPLKRSLQNLQDLKR